MTPARPRGSPTLERTPFSLACCFCIPRKYPRIPWDCVSRSSSLADLWLSIYYADGAPE